VNLKYKTLNELLAEPSLSRVNDDGTVTSGNIIVDTSAFYPQGAADCMKMRVGLETDPDTIERESKRLYQMAQFLHHYRVITTPQVKAEAINAKRHFSRRRRSFKKFRDDREKRSWDGSELLGSLSRLELALRRVIKCASRSEYPVEHPELYNSVAGIVYSIANLKGIGDGKKPDGLREEGLRTDENLVALALYISFFECRASCIVTRDTNDFPRLISESKAFFESMHPKTSEPNLNSEYSRPRDYFRWNLARNPIKIYAQVPEWNNSCITGRYFEYGLPCAASPLGIETPRMEMGANILARAASVMEGCASQGNARQW